MLIRRSHECTHFFTKQVYGSSRNNLHDELIADFIGLYDAFGFYRADWFLRFMGLIPGNGNRLTIYTEGLSPAVKKAVADLAVSAAHGLEQWSKTSHFAEIKYEEMIKAMCRAGISGIISGKLSI